ncbi:MAG: hypothetical protein HOV76_00945 [Hamadaea sp.]|nr:hypothetical protein [Hamadaea sp.]
MPSTIGRALGVALVGLTLIGAAACAAAKPAATPVVVSAPPTTTGELPVSPSPVASASSAAPSSAGSAGPKLVPACDAVLRARQTAAEALSPVRAVLTQSGLFHDDLAKATRDLMVVLTALHAAVGSATELAGDPKLKAKIAAYQLSVEQAIVAVESSDSEQAKLMAVIDSPAVRTAEKAVVAACS